MWKFWATLFLCILAIPLVPFAILGELPGTSWLDYPGDTEVFAIGIVLLTSDIFLPIPSSVVSVFLGARLGLWKGSAAIALGLNVSVILGYIVGWWVGNPLLRRFSSEEDIAVIRKFENRFSYLTLAFLRTVPVLAEASVLTAGVARLKPSKVLPTLIIANVALALLYAAIGNAGEEESSSLILLLGGLGIPMCSVLVVYGVSRLFFRETTPS